MVAPEIGQSRKLSTRMVLVLEYDGTNYFGFQWQANGPTIQGALENALEKLTGEKTRVLGSSRTDTGVHARGQVVSFSDRFFFDAGRFYNRIEFSSAGRHCR